MTNANADFRFEDAVDLIRQAQKMSETGQITELTAEEAIMAVNHYGYVID